MVVEDRKLQIHRESSITRKIRSMRRKQWVVFDDVDAYWGRNQEKGDDRGEEGHCEQENSPHEGRDHWPFPEANIIEGSSMNSGGGAKRVTENKKIQNHEEGRCKAFSC
jgi:hypothetical protein